MNEELRKLYDFMIAQGMIPRDGSDFAKFEAAHQDPQRQKALFKFLDENKKAGMDEQTFITTFFGKKKDGGQPQSAPSGDSSASSSLSNVPVPSAAPNSEPDIFDPGAGMDKPIRQEPVTPPTPGELLAPTPQESVSAPQPMQNEPQIDLSITGDEDPVAAGEALRANMAGATGGYDYKKKYDQLTAYRAEKRNVENTLMFGQRARTQMSFTAEQLARKYGGDWQDVLAKTSASLDAADPDNMTPEQIAQYKSVLDRYNGIVADPLYQQYAGAARASDKAYEAYKSLSGAGEYGKVESTRKAKQRAREISELTAVTPEAYAAELGTRALQGAIRTGANLLSSIISLPRTIARSTGLQGEDLYLTDILASKGDELNQAVETNLPKASRYEQPVFAKQVPFKNLIAQVDNNGQLVGLRDKAGDSVPVTPETESEFNNSGLAKQAKSEFTGTGNVIDKVAGITTDLLLMRGLGGGTKTGTFLTSFGMTYNQSYQEAIRDLRMDPNSAAQYAMTTGAIQAAIEAEVGGIETNFLKAGSTAGKLTRAEAAALLGKATPIQKAAIRMRPIIDTVVGENTEEFLQQIADNALKAHFNSVTGAKLDDTFTAEDAKEILLLTTLAVAPMGGIETLHAVDDARRRATFALADDPARFEYVVKQMQDRGAIAPEAAVLLNERANKLAAYARNLPQYLSDDARSTVLAKEWNRMELEARAKDPDILPAQAEPAKEAAKQLQEEIKTDLQESEKSPTIQIGGISVPIEEKTVNPPIEVKQQLPDEYRENPPEEPRSTVVAQAYANEVPANDIAADATTPAVSDEIGDIGIQVLQDKGYDFRPEEAGQIKRFFVESLASGQHEGQNVEQAFNALADEWIDTNSEQRPLRDRLDIQSVEDTIADFFAGGGKVNPVSYNRHGDRNIRKGNLSNLYFSKNGANIDQMAAEWADKWGMDEGEVINRIVDFMHAYPGKNINDYMAARIEYQQMTKRHERENALFESAFEPGMDAVTDEERNHIISTAKETVAEEIKAASPEAISALETWLSDFANESGTVDVQAMRRAVENSVLTPLDDDFDAEAAKKWDAMPLEAQAIVRNIAAGSLTNNVIAASVPTGEPVKEDDTRQSFEEFTQQYAGDTAALVNDWNAGGEFKWLNQLSDEAYSRVEQIVHNYERESIGRPGGTGNQLAPALPGDNTAQDQTPQQNQNAEPTGSAQVEESTRRPVESDTSGVKQVLQNAATTQDHETARQEVEAMLKTIDLPTALTPAIVAELEGQGLATTTEANALHAHLTADTAIDPATLDKAMQAIEALREVPTWVSALDEAVRARADQVISGTVKPGQPIVIQHEGNTIVANVSPDQAGKLLEMGATFNGRAWVAPAELHNEVMAKIFANDQVPAPTSRMGRAIGATSRFLSSPFGWSGIKRMNTAIDNAATVEEKIAAAERMLGGERQNRTAEVGKRLSIKYGIQVITDPAKIADALTQMGRPELIGNPLVRGYQYRGRVYVNLENADAETPIHEFGHLWLNSIAGTELHRQGQEAVRGSKYEEAVRNEPFYRNLSDEEILDEALALAIGQRGALMTDTATWNRFKTWLNDMWKAIKAKVGIDVQDMSAQEFADMVVMDLLGNGPATDSPLKTTPHAQFLFVGEQAPQLKDEAAVALDLAKEMEHQGVDPDQIWNATGWFRGADSFWRYMIADRGAAVKVSAKTLENESMDSVFSEKNVPKYRLDELLDHPELYEQMPTARDIEVTVNPNEYTKFTFVNGKPVINLNINAISQEGPNADNILIGHLIHELQHWIQYEMGFAHGGNPNVATVIADHAVELMDPDSPTAIRLKTSTPHKLYMNLAGEVEARLSEEFRDHLPEELDQAPTKYMDVAIEDQIIFFGDMAAAAQKLAAPQFLFGRKQVQNAAAIQAAEKIIADDIAAGNDPAINGTLIALSKLGINKPTADRLYAEAMVKNKGARIVSPLGKPAFVEMAKEKVVNTFFEFFRVRGLMPKSLHEHNLSRKAEIAGHVYAMQQAVNRLDNAIKKLAGKKSTERTRGFVWQQVQNILEGTQDINTIDPALHDGILELRTRMDIMTKQLVLSGAVGPNMAITMLQNAGINVTATDVSTIEKAGRALSKAPADRTDDENQIIEDFLQQYGGGLGTYLYRSYQANDDPHWKEKVPEDVVARAKAKLEEMIRGEMLDEIQALNDKHDDIDGRIAGIEQEISDHLDGARAKITQARKDIADIQTKQNQAIQDKGKPNKTLQRQELAMSRRLRALESMLRQAQAVADLSPADFVLVTQAPGFDPTSMNNTMRAVYSRRKKIIALEDRKDRAGFASAARLQALDKQLANVDNEIETMLYREPVTGSIMGVGKLGSVSSQITRGRRKGDEFPVEFRDLLGEYRDPRINMMRSVLRVATALEHQRFLHAVKAAGVQEGWLATREDKTGNLIAQIAAPGSDTMDPLDGMYTTPEIAQVFASYNNRQMLGPWARAYYKLVGAAKVGKTILAPAAQARNFYSNVMQAQRNGWLGLPDGGRKLAAFIEGWKAYSVTQSPQEAAEFEDMIRLGVLGKSVSAGDLKQAAGMLTGDLREEGFAEQSITTPPGFMRKIFNASTHIYQASDELFKIWGFRIETQRYAKSLFGKNVEGLTPDELEQAKQRAARVMKLITPDYSLIPKIGEILRKIPVAGTFISWPMEMFRNYFNWYSLVREEYQDPRTRSLAITRLLYAGAYMGTWIGVAALAKALLGISDKEEDAIEPWLKPWQQGTTKIFLSKDDKTGEWSFFNLGYIEPYQFWKKPINTLLTDNNNTFMENMSTAILQFVDPIIQPDIVASTLVQGYFNIDVNTGKKIMIPEYGYWHPENLDRMSNFIRKRMQPGILKSAFDLWDASTIGRIDEYGNVQTIGSTMLNTIGLNTEKIRPRIAFDKYLVGQRQHKEAILQAFDSSRYKELANLNLAKKEGGFETDVMEKRKAAAAERMQYMYDLTNEVYNQHLQDIGYQVRNAIEYLGMNPAQVIDELKSKRYSKEEIAVILGKKPSIPPKIRKIKF